MHAWIRFNTQLQTKGFRCQGWRSKLQNYKSNDKTKSGIRTQIHIWIQLPNFIYEKVIFTSKIIKLSVKWKSHLPYFLSEPQINVIVCLKWITIFNYLCFCFYFKQCAHSSITSVRICCLLLFNNRRGYFRNDVKQQQIDC